STFHELNITLVNSVKDFGDCKPWAETIVENDIFCFEGAVDFTNTLREFTAAVLVEIKNVCDKIIMRNLVSFKKCGEKPTNKSGCYCPPSDKNDVYRFICYKRVNSTENISVIQATVQELNGFQITEVLKVPAFKHVDQTRFCRTSDTSEDTWKIISVTFIVITAILLLGYLVIALIHFIRKYRAHSVSPKSKDKPIGKNIIDIEMAEKLLASKIDNDSCNTKGVLSSRVVPAAESKQMPVIIGYNGPSSTTV
ncbi:hypothetical protein BgiMline_031516, partial [Biomphalaria glabrata]